MSGNDENAMPHGHQCTPFTQTRGQSSELCREIRVLRPGSRPGCLGQGAAHIDVPLAGVARQLFARRLMIPRAHAGPRGEVAIGRDVGHVGPDCRHQRFCHACTNPWDGLEEVDGLGQKRIGTFVQLSLNFCGRAGHRLVSLVVLASQFLEEEALGWGQVACQ